MLSLRLKVQCMIWRWQLECNDAWTLLLITKFGWSVKIKLIQEELFLWTCVGSLIIWWKPFNILNEKSFEPSNELMSLDHQEVDLAVKSPNMTETDGLKVRLGLFGGKTYNNKRNVLMQCFLRTVSEFCITDNFQGTFMRFHFMIFTQEKISTDVDTCQ